MTPTRPSEPATLVGFTTLQFHRGGLFDGEPIEDAIHLVRRTGQGTPGMTLCGRDRFADGSPGWSVGGGFSGDWQPCEGCAIALDANPLPVNGMHARLFVGAAS